MVILRDRWRSNEGLADSPYYFEAELCGGAVTVSFSNNVSPRTFPTALVVAQPS
jgi:hypothetical protein